MHRAEHGMTFLSVSEIREPSMVGCWYSNGRLSMGAGGGWRRHPARPYRSQLHQSLCLFLFCIPFYLKMKWRIVARANLTFFAEICGRDPPPHGDGFGHMEMLTRWLRLHGKMCSPQPSRYGHSVGRTTSLILSTTLQPSPWHPGTTGF